MKIGIVIAVVAAAVVVGLVAISSGSDDDGSPSELVLQADRLCEKATARLKKIPPVYLSTYVEVVPTIARNERALARGLAALEALESEDRAAVERLARLVGRQAKEVGAANATYAGDDFNLAAHDRHVRVSQRLDREIGVLARDLGARACVHPPSRARYL